MDEIDKLSIAFTALCVSILRQHLGYFVFAL